MLPILIILIIAYFSLFIQSITIILIEIHINRSCDKLRCTNCDFKIVSFNDNVWKDSVDILFFRNYIFDESKLKAVLNRKPGTYSIKK